MWELVSTNLTQLGGPMGTERTFVNWRKFFKSKINAMEYAQADYHQQLRKFGQEPKDFKWGGNPDTRLTSGDLLFVMYSLVAVKLEDEDDQPDHPAQVPARVTTYGGTPWRKNPNIRTVQHWQLEVDGEFLADSSIPSYEAWFKSIADRLNGV